MAYFIMPMMSWHGFLTANDVTPYVTSGLSCAGDPLVVEVPLADTPAKDFWSVIVYSMKTKGFVEYVETVGLASTGLDKMKKNDDGSVDVFSAPKPPEGMASNWIPTGEDLFLIFRLYGPDKALFDKSWGLGDVEKLKSPCTHITMRGSVTLGEIAPAVRTRAKEAKAASCPG